MFDFALTNSGDIVLKKQEKYPVLEISWHESAYPVFSLQFSQQNASIRTKPPDTFCLSFHISNKKSVDKTKAGCLHSTDVIRQQLVILLRTELGSVSFRKELGTKLISAKHKDIYSQAVREYIRQTVYDAVEPILYNPEVRVLREKRNGSDFFCQNLNVYIYQDGEQLYEFPITDL